MEAAKYSPSRQSVSPDVWTAAFERRAERHKAPLIPLENLGIIREHEQDVFLTTLHLKALVSGAEAAPYLDEKVGVVYKLFDLRAKGHLGVKIILKRHAENEFRIEHQDATLLDTLEKIMILNDSGALISEIVGLSANGDFLITKQPRAYPYHDYLSDRAAAIDNMRAIHPVGPTLGHPIVITWVLDQAWMVGDLHTGNIMRDSNNVPTVIDALTGVIPKQAIKEVPGLLHAIEDARDFRKNNLLPFRKQFDDVDDDLL